jgi:hypothetical protein
MASRINLLHQHISALVCKAFEAGGGRAVFTPWVALVFLDVTVTMGMCLGKARASMQGEEGGWEGDHLP